MEISKLLQYYDSFVYLDWFIHFCNDFTTNNRKTIESGFVGYVKFVNILHHFLIIFADITKTPYTGKFPVDFVGYTAYSY